ncbi:MAG: lipocalin family protein [Bacteroidaceae bacterium]|nr:lipocalin family protein [Bacteroidaceae bacterium]
MRKTLFLVSLFSLLAGCSKLTVDNSVVKDFDTERFLGNWYEIARFDHRFERGMEQTKAAYTLQKDGTIKVLNTGMKNGKPKQSEGRAKLTDTPALLRVSFFGPFYSDYRIMLLDKNYQYALIGGGSDNYLWILSRSSLLSDDVKTTILDEAKRRGYDISKLIWVTHNTPNSDE